MKLDTSSSILEVQGLSKKFGGVEALRNVSFAIPDGGFSGIIGPNGAGKTTLFNCLSGIVIPDQGNILFGSPKTSLCGLRADQVCAQGVVRSFQSIRLFSEMTVLENLLTGSHLQSHAPVWDILFQGARFREEEAEFRSRGMDLLGFVGLEHFAHERAGKLSYGRQRVLEIARALAAKPKLLLLDEPAAGMNPRETEDLANLLSAITERGVTIVLIEHDMRLVMGLCGHLVVLDHGTVLASGKPQEVAKDPQVVEAYLGRKRAKKK